MAAFSPQPKRPRNALATRGSHCRRHRFSNMLSEPNLAVPIALNLHVRQGTKSFMVGNDQYTVPHVFNTIKAALLQFCHEGRPSLQVSWQSNCLSCTFTPRCQYGANTCCARMLFVAGANASQHDADQPGLASRMSNVGVIMKNGDGHFSEEATLRSLYTSACSHFVVRSTVAGRIRSFSS